LQFRDPSIAPAFDSIAALPNEPLRARPRK
jgi:hypothetical protein